MQGDRVIRQLRQLECIMMFQIWIVLVQLGKGPLFACKLHPVLTSEHPG